MFALRSPRRGACSTHCARPQRSAAWCSRSRAAAPSAVARAEAGVATAAAAATRARVKKKFQCVPYSLTTCKGEWEGEGVCVRECEAMRGGLRVCGAV